MRELTVTEKEYLVWLQDTRNYFYNIGDNENALNIQKDIDNLIK